MIATRRKGLDTRRRYQCGECHRRDYGNYFLTSTLCKKCAAKRRRRLPNPPLELSTSMVVTQNVGRRLRKTAEAEVPRGAVEKAGNLAGALLFPISWVSCPFVARTFFDEWSGALWLFVFAWALLLPYAGLLAIDAATAKPRRERQRRVDARVLALAEERRREIEERKAFYSSPEWKLIREQVIREEGRTCADCGRQINDGADIAVDHKQPRSKYPELALRRDNLRVICRQCNSRKAARDWIDPDAPPPV